MLHEKLCYNLITKQVNVREEWNGKMALICKYGTKECSFCGSCFHRGESKTEAQCSVCGRMVKSESLRSGKYYIALCPSCYKAVKYGGM